MASTEYEGDVIFKPSGYFLPYLKSIHDEGKAGDDNTRKRSIELINNPNGTPNPLFVAGVLSIATQPGELLPLEVTNGSTLEYNNKITGSIFDQDHIVSPEAFSSRRRQDDVLQNGLSVLSANMGNFAGGAYPPFADKSYIDAQTTNKGKFLDSLVNDEKIKNTDIINLQDIPYDEEFFLKLERLGYVVAVQAYMVHPYNTEFAPAVLVTLINKNRIRPQNIRFSTVPHVQFDKERTSNGLSNWHNANRDLKHLFVFGEGRETHKIYQSPFVGQTLLINFNIGNIPVTVGNGYISPTSNYMQRNESIKYSLQAMDKVSGESGIKIFTGDMNAYGPEVSLYDKTLGFLPGFPWALVRSLIPTIIMRGKNTSSLRELIGHQIDIVRRTQGNWHIANLKRPELTIVKEKQLFHNQVKLVAGALVDYIITNEESKTDPFKMEFVDIEFTDHRAVYKKGIKPTDTGKLITPNIIKDKEKDIKKLEKQYRTLLLQDGRFIKYTQDLFSALLQPWMEK